MSDVADEELERCQKRVGTTLRGKWTLDGLLGIGGMAAVYSAHHKMGRRDAIKILHPHIAFSKELRARFEQEAHAVSKLSHRAVARVLDIDTAEDGAPFLVMELLEGESLGQRAHRLGGVGEQELLGWVETLLEVLGEAHAAGIVHRDIKPDNLFITRDGSLKVLDFGIARMKEGAAGVHTKTGAMLGTTAYMAPEQVHGRPVDGRADLYAVGATMFRLLSGRKIHEAKTDAELLIKMGTTPAPPLRSIAPSVSEPVARIVDRALGFEVEDRYASAGEMLAEVRDCLSSAPAPSLPVRIDTGTVLSTRQPVAPTLVQSPIAAPSRRSPALPITIGLVALLAGVGVTLALLPKDCGRETPPPSVTAAPDTTAESEQAPPRTPPATTSSTPPAAPSTSEPDTTAPPVESSSPKLKHNPFTSPGREKKGPDHPSNKNR